MNPQESGEVEPDYIQLHDQNDILFATIADGALVTGATLPSGLKVPMSGAWKIDGYSVVRVPKCDACQDTGRAYYQEDLYGPCPHCIKGNFGLPE